MTVPAGTARTRARWCLDGSALFAYFALGSVFSALPRFVTENLGGSKAIAGFSVSVFFVAAIGTRPLIGRFVDRHGRQGVLRIGPIALALAFVAMSFANSIPALLVLRFLQGVAGASFYVAAVSASTDLAEEGERGSAVARLSLALYAGFALGPVAGEWLLNQGAPTAWRLLAALELVAAAIVWFVPETHEGAPRALTAASVPLFHPRAIVPGVFLLTLGVGYTSITSQAAVYARDVGLDGSGPMFVGFAGAILLVRLFAGKLSDRIGALRVLYPGAGFLIAGLLVVAGLRMPIMAVVGAALVGTGWALVFPAMVSFISDLVPDAERGAALGSAIACMDVGQGFGGYAVGAVADVAGFGWAYLLPALLALAGLAVFWRATPQPPEFSVSVSETLRK